MDAPDESQTSDLLAGWSRGERAALERLIPRIHDELHRLASSFFRGERAGHTLQPTALVNEVYLLLARQKRASWSNRRQVMAVCSRMMRRILVDHARAAQASKRGGGQQRVTLTGELLWDSGPDPDLLALDEALRQLADLDPQQAQVVELRFLGGLSVEETAAILGVSHPTVKRDWAMARAWLFRKLREPA
jgi:RNA polymerase sigma factor (TIGR02999 family)